MSSFLTKDDYEEARCLLDMHPEVERIPTMRVIEQLDTYLHRNDYAAAERHLNYWLMEADHGRDLQGRLTVLNEQIGLYRKLGKEAECLSAIESVLSLVETLDMAGTVTYGTTMVNAATGYKAFGRAADALPLYEKAMETYGKTLEPADPRVAALYNNMALALVDQSEFRRAEDYYHKALAIVQQQKNGELDEAITWLNLADLVVAEVGHEAGENTIEEYLTRAEDLINTPTLPRDGYYAFVCDKCAPVFGYYGYFLVEKDLKERAKEIYERN